MTPVALSTRRRLAARAASSSPARAAARSPGSRPRTIRSRARARTVRAASTASGSSLERASSSTDGRSRSCTLRTLAGGGMQLFAGAGVELDEEALEKERMAARVADRDRLVEQVHDAAILRDQPVALAERVAALVRAVRRLE